MSVVSLNSLRRWQVQVYVYCARRIPAHLRCTQCSIMLHIVDICILPCICLRQISQIQTCLCVVVGLGFVSTSPAFIRSSVGRVSVFGLMWFGLMWFGLLWFEWCRGSV